MNENTVVLVAFTPNELRCIRIAIYDSLLYSPMMMKTPEIQAMLADIDRDLAELFESPWEA